jgi:hypothetical protein
MHEFSFTAEVMVENFGDEWEDFVVVDPKAVGSGCMAQVHRGYIKSGKNQEKRMLAKASRENSEKTGITIVTEETIRQEQNKEKDNTKSSEKNPVVGSLTNGGTAIVGKDGSALSGRAWLEEKIGRRENLMANRGKTEKNGEENVEKTTKNAQKSTDGGVLSAAASALFGSGSSSGSAKSDDEDSNTPLETVPWSAGQAIALKIKHPNVDYQIAADLELLEMAVNTLEYCFPIIR